MNDVTNTTDVVTEPNESTTPDGTTSLNEVETLKAELAKNNELITKLRKFEKENKQRAEAEAKAKEQALAEQGQYKALYEELNNKLRTQAIDSVLDAELTLAGAKSLKTVKALVDKTQIEFEGDSPNGESIRGLIEGLKKEHAILFESQEPVVPSVKRAGDNEPVGGYEKEMRAAKTAKEIESVLKKYGKF